MLWTRSAQLLPSLHLLESHSNCSRASSLNRVIAGAGPEPSLECRNNVPNIGQVWDTKIYLLESYLVFKDCRICGVFYVKVGKQNKN